MRITIDTNQSPPDPPGVIKTWQWFVWIVLGGLVLCLPLGALAVLSGHPGTVLLVVLLVTVVVRLYWAGGKFSGFWNG